jgi:hypothetical protein
MAPVRLTYCGNVHAAPDLAAAMAALRAHTAPVAAAARAAGRSFGIGAWWPRDVAMELAADRASRDRLAVELWDLDLPLWTLNVFPLGGFHDEVVKTAVYQPDWGAEERLLYTRTCAEVGASLVPRGTVLPLSTLPLGYRGPGDPPADLRLMARNLARCASAFAAIEETTGVCCVPNAALRFSPPSDTAQGSSLVRSLMPFSRRNRPPKRAGTKVTDGSQQQVWVLRDGSPEAVEVTAGVSNGRQTEIVGGALEAGMEVITDVAGATQ